MSLDNRHALVTGGGRGIGRAVAFDLARAGASVTVTARTRSEIDAVAAEIRAAGGRATAVTLDVSVADEVARAFAEARAAQGPVDVLINGAGVAPSAPLVKTDEAAWRSAIETNLCGVFYCMREALPEMSARGWGRVVNVASIASKTGSPYISAYAASKHGVLGLTRCAALEHARVGVTVNAVCPGYVDTPMTETSIARVVSRTGLTSEAVRRKIEEMSPQGRLYTVEEVSALVIFLCGEAARGINGQALSVDGGTVLA